MALIVCSTGKLGISSERTFTSSVMTFSHSADLKSINSSYITLVPKKDNPETVNDFRPISLLNTPLKIIAKLLTNRL